MKRKYRILTVFTAAAITFASLMIFAGPQRFTENFQRHPGMQHCNHNDIQNSKTR
ncbi:MAG: hypothetical protein JST63_17330 [Bacteroidetes bacterium]|nr:hypothetical protein [Bacteroidota bacterium]